MRIGGGIVIGTAALLAWLDGGLSACLVGTVLGFGVYKAARAQMDAAPAKIFEIQKAALDHNLKVTLSDPSLNDQGAREAKRAMGEQLEKLSGQLGQQNKWNRELATASGVAAFACPALGVPLLLANTTDRWEGPIDRYLARCEQRRQDSTQQITVQIPIPV